MLIGMAAVSGVAILMLLLPVRRRHFRSFPMARPVQSHTPGIRILRDDDELRVALEQAAEAEGRIARKATTRAQRYIGSANIVTTPQSPANSSN